MKKIIFLTLITLISCSNESETLNESVQLNTNEQEGDVLSNNKVYDSMPEMNIDISKEYSAVIKTSMGDMSIEFFTEDAPMTVNNFINLSRDGYYDNVIFHRVISGFMIQGGDPSGTGHGEMGKYPGYKFEDELKELIANFGLEYWYTDNFAIRLGYIYDKEGNIMNPTFGAGIRFDRYGFDFGYTAGDKKKDARSNTLFF